MTEDGSNPFSHIHKGLDHLNKPASDIEKMEGIAWGYDPDKTSPHVKGEVKKTLDQEELETLTYLNEGERETTSIEKVLATLSGDMVGLAYRTDFMRSSIAVKGKGRNDDVKLVGGSTPKISVPTTLGKVRRVFSNQGDKQKETGHEEEWSQASG